MQCGADGARSKSSELSLEEQEEQHAKLSTWIQASSGGWNGLLGCM